MFEHRNSLWNCGLDHDNCLRYLITIVCRDNGSDYNHPQHNSTDGACHHCSYYDDSCVLDGPRDCNIKALGPIMAGWPRSTTKWCTSAAV
jgi:hypothetical protein